jgi:predicted dehydrogenase
MQRRTFLTQTAATAAATALSAQRVRGANERIGIATIGTGGRGRALTSNLRELPDAEVRAVCDIYETNLALGAEVAGGNVKTYHDYRRLLENKEIDAVVVATPDHWHAQMTIDAVEAGKDVYVEKPMVHLPEEGFQVIEATRRTKRIVQVGTQRRSYDLFQEGKKVMDSGRLGRYLLPREDRWSRSMPMSLCPDRRRSSAGPASSVRSPNDSSVNSWIALKANWPPDQSTRLKRSKRRM